MPAYTQFWHPEDGAVTITGLTDLFDPNYYAGQSRDEGFATGEFQAASTPDGTLLTMDSGDTLLLAAFSISRCDMKNNSDRCLAETIK